VVSVVIKRDGKEEPFIEEKIVVSLLKAGATVDVARRIARKIECQFADAEKVSARDLTRAILTELKRINEQWFTNWIVFDRAVKRRATEKEMS
jgi:transcriptional regulator NrdR family protein